MVSEQDDPVLANYSNTILQMLESGKNIYVIYAKAFDKVEFAIVLEKTKKN